MKALLLATALAASVAASPFVFAHDAHAATAASPAISQAQADTQDALRDLWVEHVFWIRNYVIASKAGDANRRKVATNEILANATTIAGAVGNFYGKAAGDQMLKLLAGHWTAVKDYSDATFDHKGKGQQAATDKLTANAKDIAAFLSKANPYLPENTLVGLLTTHGAHHVAQIQEIAKNDYAGEAKTWNTMRAHMFVIADALTGALVKQFPDKF
jgi:hypothetical protein